MKKYIANANQRTRRGIKLWIHNVSRHLYFESDDISRMENV